MQGTAIEPIPHEQPALIDAERPQIADVSDDALIATYAAIAEERERINAILAEKAAPIKAEIERRLRARRAAEPASTHTIALPHPRARVELETQYGPYVFDVEALELAATALPEAEAAKLVKHTPETTIVVPATTEAGNVGSIKALATKYAGSEVGEILKGAMKRPRLEDKLIIAPLRPALPPGGTA